jgi:uncharacterized protein
MMFIKPLTDVEFDSLANVLSRFGNKRAMSIEQLDGFLAAIVCYPDPILPPEYLPEIWGDAMVNEDSFSAQPLLQDFRLLVTRHKFALTETLQSGDVFTPVLLPNNDGVYLGNDWANGFVRGMQLRQREWAVLLNDENHGGSLVPIFALAHEHDPDPATRPYKEPITAERREQLIIGVAAGVMNIYKYFRQQNGAQEGKFDPGSSSYRRVVPKTGRNDPCPCGSGKKYKHCCGKVTLH